MDIEIWKFAFDTVINKIINHINNLLQEDILKNKCKYIYLVGGFSCSKYFQYRMKNEFEKKYNLIIIIPKYPSLCTVQGAAYFGIRKNYITARKSKYCYGIRTIRNIKNAKQIYKMSDKNINNKLNNIDGKIKNCFHIMVNKNTLLRMGDKIQITVKSTEKISNLVILKSEKENPQTAIDGEIIGNFNIKYDEIGQAIIEFYFNDTTFSVYTYCQSNPNTKRILKQIDY